MWVFGGRDDDNNKLNDLWKFDIQTGQWEEVKPADGQYPQARSGHSCDVFEGQYLIVFGGIFEITKELNDLHMFDLKKKKWVTVFEESNSPVKGRDHSPTFTHEGDGFHQSLGGASGTIGSPIPGKKSLLASPIKHHNGAA